MPAAGTPRLQLPQKSALSILICEAEFLPRVASPIID
jgi:hypothetical protein